MRSNFFGNHILLFSIFMSLSVVSFSIYFYSDSPQITGKTISCLTDQCSELAIPSPEEAKQESYQSVIQASNAEIYVKEVSEKSEYKPITKEELIKYQDEIYSVYGYVKSTYDDSSLLVKFYGNDPSIQENHDKIKISLNSVKDEFLDVHVKVVDEYTKDSENRIKLAKQEVKKNEIMEENKDKLDQYYANPFPVTPDFSETPSCSFAISAAAVSSLTDTGDVGISADGTKCPIPPVTLEPIVHLGPSEHPLPPSFAAFYVNPSSSISDDSSFEALAIIPGPEGPQFGFFLAPSHTAIESQIASFIERLIFGESSLGPESPSEVLVRPNHLPWSLYFVLVGLFIELLFFEYIFLSTSERIASKINRDLSNGKYLSAIEMYKELIHSDPYLDIELKKQVIGYFLHYKQDLQALGLKIDFALFENEKNYSDSKKNFNHNLTHESRVEKMIRDALKDSLFNKKIALTRMPIISEAYKNLDPLSRKNLASLYEELVYSLRG